MRHIINQMAKLLPEDTRQTPEARSLAAYGCPTVMHVVRLLAPQLENENHTKDVGDFRPLDRFARLLSRSSDVAVVTAREVAENIRRKHYPIRTADGG